MRIIIDNCSSGQVAAAMDVLRAAGIEPLAGGTVENIGLVVVSEHHHGQAIEILRRANFAARTA